MMCQKSKDNKKIYIITIAIQFSILLMFLTLSNYDVTSFDDRIIGNGVLEGIDISNRANIFFIVLFIAIPISIFIITKLLNKVLQNINIKTLKFMSLIAILSIIHTIFSFMNILNNVNDYLSISAMVLIGINITLVLMNLVYSRILKKKMEVDDIKWAFLAAVPVTFLGTLIFHKLNIQIINNEINWTILYLVFTIILFIIINFKFINKDVLKKAYMFFLFAPLMEFIFLELYNILNQYNIILEHKIRIIVILYFICFMFSIVYYLMNYKKKIKWNYTKYYYPIILVTIALIIATPNMITIVDTDFFEAANHGIGVYEFLKYGKLPLLETFDAHMINSQFYGIIYGILNSDITGAIFCTYTSYSKVLYCIILYLFFSKIFSRNSAFLMTLFFPFQMDVGIDLLYMSLIAIISLIKAYKNKDIKFYLMFWFSLVFLCVWKLDIGFSISLSTVITLIYLLIKNKNKVEIRNSLIAFVAIIGISAVITLSICLLKNINPITRAIEFISIAMSNSNWGIASLGESSQTAYLICYYIVPLVIISMLIYIIYKQKTKKNINTINIILITLGLFFVFNIQRGMIRHSLYENTTQYILSSSLIFISLFLYEYFYNRKESIFVIIYIIIILISGLLISNNFNVNNNILDESIKKYTTFKMHEDSFDQKVERIQISQRMQEEYKDLKMVLGSLLEEDETYLDVTNQTLLYALIDKEKPVYVNQSPGLLSGELGQQLFIEEVENSSKDVVIALRARNKLHSQVLDGILNDYRYYLLTEYTYQNYIAIATVNEYDILVRKDKYNEKTSKLKEIENDALQLMIDEEYLKYTLNSFELGMLPYIWGQYDELKDNNKLILDLLNDEENSIVLKDFKLDINRINKENGNYIKLLIQSDKDTRANIKLKKDSVIVGEYHFDIKKGLNNYMIRVSTIVSWYKNNIDSMTLNTQHVVKLKDISILEANTLKQIK